MNKILFMGLDVDDKAFHLCAVNKDNEKQFQFSCRPNSGVLAAKLEKFKGENCTVKICYEATYLGFSLQRDLTKRGFDCDVIAPSLVPVVPGQKVKTNRLDCEKLAVHLSKNDLTKVHIPSAEEEAVRDLVRGRKFLTDQLRRHKQFVLSFCRRQGWDYRQEMGTRSYWTIAHFAWLEKLIKTAESRTNRFTLWSAVEQVKRVKSEIELFETEIQQIAMDPFYRRKVAALTCFRGISLVAAMTFITELGDPNRFGHPAKIASYAGLDICEYTSGKEKRWSITKMGNCHLRTIAVECVQSASKPPRVSKRLKALRDGVDPLFIDIADRCARRLYVKSSRLFFRGKPKNKIKVACARELYCFIWEALKKAQELDTQVAS